MSNYCSFQQKLFNLAEKRMSVGDIENVGNIEAG